MLTAHLPAGYLMARAFPRNLPGLMPAVLAGSLLPDLDMLWFHLVDHGTVQHHMYWPHVPLFWLIVAVFCLPMLRHFGLVKTGLAFLAAVFLHLLLDTVAGGILWLYPFNTTLHYLVEVPASHENWIVSFLLHWTMLLELLIWAAAGWVWFASRVQAAGRL